MGKITQGVGAVKEQLAELLDEQVVNRACNQVGHKWRERLLDPATTVRLFVLQILHGNMAISGLRHLGDLQFTDAAYCEARKRIPLAVFQALVRWFWSEVQETNEALGRWCGHRVWLIDGSSCSMPDMGALREYFGLPPKQKAGCGFPTATLMFLCDMVNGFAVQAEAAALRVHDMSQAAKMHEALRENDVLVGDRGFCSFTHVALCQMRWIHAVFRMHQRINVSFRTNRPARHQRPKSRRKGAPTSEWVRRLGSTDQLVRWLKPKRKPEWLSQEQYDELPESLLVRELRYRVSRKGFRSKKVTLVTTLLDPAVYSKEALADLYMHRWQIETNLRHLKQTLGMDVLKSKTVEGIQKEIAVFTLVYNLVRLVMLEAGVKQGVAPNRISFIDALRWLRHATPGEPVPPLRVNRDRAGRVEPRVVKRRPKSFPWMSRPRRVLRQRLAGRRVTR